jgi:DNA-binding SARP family transcriptional activator
MASLDVRVLGPMALVVDGTELDVRGAKQRALLATLALHHDHVVSVGALVTHLWDEPLPERADHTLQQHVSSLRKTLQVRGAESRLTTREPGYALGVDRLDVDDFDAACARATALVAVGDLVTGLGELDAAAAVLRGDPLADVRLSQRLDAAATRIEERVHAATEARIDVLLALGRHRDAIVVAEQAIEEQPYRERFRAQMMLALYRDHRQKDALAVYRVTRQLMIEELGVEPGRALRELEDAILRQDPGLDDGAADAAAIRRTFRAGEVSDRGWVELPDGQAIALVHSLLIGRSPEAGIRLVDSRVSREHARVELRSGYPHLVDLGSTNGSSVNGRPVTDSRLVDGDEIGIGGVVLRYRTATPPVDG